VVSGSWGGHLLDHCVLGLVVFVFARWFFLMRFVSMVFPARGFCLHDSVRMCSMLFRVKSAVVIPGGAL
jgi:hypothetical protein